MKKIFTLFAALVCGLSMSAKTLYLTPSDNWKKDGARFAVYAFDNGNSTNEWYDMTAVSGNANSYQATIDDKYPTVIFCRMNPNAAENKWDNKWNQTQDMTIENGKDLCVIGEGWDNNGSWSVYSSQGGGDNPGGDNPGGDNPGGGNAGDKDFFLKGYCNGADITTPTAEEQFEGGILEYTFTGDASGKGYFFILVCEKGQVVGECYMAKEYSEASHCTLFNEQKTGAVQKMAVPQGTVTFYLYDNGNDSYELSTEPLAGKTLVGGGESAVESISISSRITKTVINGQVIIIKDGVRYNLLGAQVQ